jgi:hypothetical protein
MKVTINKPADYIDLNDLTGDHFIVGTVDGKAKGILTRDPHPEEKYHFAAIHRITIGDRFFGKYDCVKEATKEWMKRQHHSAHAFRTYQEAFKFIAENL